MKKTVKVTVQSRRMSSEQNEQFMLAIDVLLEEMVRREMDLTAESVATDRTQISQDTERQGN